MDKLVQLRKGTILITYDELSHDLHKWRGVASLKEDFCDPNLYSEGATALEALERLLEKMELKEDGCGHAEEAQASVL